MKGKQPGYVCNNGHLLKCFYSGKDLKRFVCNVCNDYYEIQSVKGLTVFQKAMPPIRLPVFEEEL